MIAAVLIALVASLDAAPPAPTAPTAWQDGLGAGLREVERLSDAGKADEALAIADALVARGNARGTAGGTREAAHAHYARGVVLSREGRRPEAEQDFATAAALAGPGEMRLDALYDLAVSALMEGEEARAKLPEISGAPAQPAPAIPPVIPPGVPPGVPTGPAAAPDPLDSARRAYLRARERLIDRLRAGAPDDDSRANVELVQRRLKEIEEISRKREEKKKEQQPDPSKSRDGEGSPKAREKPDQPESQDSKPKPSDPQKGQDEPQGTPQKEAPPEPPKPEDPQPDAKAGQVEKPEQVLTKEEVMRLLDMLAEREQEGRELQEQLRRARRGRARRDW